MTTAAKCHCLAALACKFQYSVRWISLAYAERGVVILQTGKKIYKYLQNTYKI